MRKYILAPVLALSLATAACTPEEQIVLGGIAGIGGGLLLADLVDANPAWTVGLGLAGAAIGAEVARNSVTGECAYKRADGRVEVRRCS